LKNNPTVDLLAKPQFSISNEVYLASNEHGSQKLITARNEDEWQLVINNQEDLYDRETAFTCDILPSVGL